MNAIIKFIDWVTYGYISDLEYQNKAYQHKVQELINKVNKCREESRVNVNRLVAENNEMMMLIKKFREKEERIKQQKRESRIRLKNGK